DQALYDQIPLAKQVAEAFQFPVFSKSGYEADDVIGTLSRLAFEEPVETYIVTGDMDTLQLVNPKVKVYTLRKGLADTVIYDEKAVKERFGFGPEAMVDYKAIRGDTSDNIPGVPGIGEKGATELILKLQTIENIFKKFAELKKLGFKDGLIKKLEAGKDSAFMSKHLSTIDLNVPGIDFSIEKCKIKPFDREKIIELFQKFEFVSLLKRLPEFGAAGDEFAEQQKKKLKRSDKEFRFTEVKAADEIPEIIKMVRASKRFAARVALDGADIYSSKIVGLVVAVEKDVYFLSAELAEKFYPIFAEPDLELVGHDLKQLIKVLWLRKIPVLNILFDVMVASYILNPGSRAHDVPSLVLRVLGKELTASSGQESLFGLDRRMIAYETFLVFIIAEHLKNDLNEINNLGLLEKIEMPLEPVLASMELYGVAVDTKLLGKLSLQVNKMIGEVSAKIYSLAGQEFNISSPLQLREILFEKLDIPVEGVKKGKTGLSTSAEELEKLAGLHPIIPEISIYRELTKLQNTYIDTLPKLIQPKTGRIHSSFNQVVTATGRLSSSEPNLQNIPIRTELGREIRKAFIAEDGYTLISADYSQIELRVVASLAEDKKMIEIFEKDEDIHRATAAAIHGVPLEQVTKEMRYSAKEVNFGVLYGMGVYGLSWRADITHQEAKDFIEKYFREFSGVKKYIDSTLAFTKKEGYCETLFGLR
ncbi:MAG: DNA polymerase I, partial [Patescibacteria group bacterium]